MAFTASESDLDEHHNVGDPDRAVHRLETIDAWLERYDPGRDSADDGDGETDH